MTQNHAGCLIRTADVVVVGKRLRALDDSAVLALVTSVGQIGIQVPLTVRSVGQTIVLVAGAHRLEAAT